MHLIGFNNRPAADIIFVPQLQSPFVASQRCVTSCHNDVLGNNCVWQPDAKLAAAMSF
jgi:hypothetical protein